MYVPIFVLSVISWWRRERMHMGRGRGARQIQCKTLSITTTTTTRNNRAPLESNRVAFLPSLDKSLRRRRGRVAEAAAAAPRVDLISAGNSCSISCFTFLQSGPFHSNTVAEPQRCTGIRMTLRTMEHSDLVTEMQQVERLSTQDRLYLARM